MKFIILSAVFILMYQSEDSYAQMKSDPIIGYIESDDAVIDYMHLESSCTKNDNNQMTLNYTSTVQTNRINDSLYELRISPIKLNTPLIKNLINCEIVLFIYIKSDGYLRFRILGSREPMTLEELKLMVENPKVLSASLTKKLDHARLVRANVEQGYILEVR